MRHMSFALTTEQVLAGTKTVTRRLGWECLRPGDSILAVRKCMGLKKGEKRQPLAVLRILDVRRESLGRMVRDLQYGRDECRREGFPLMDPAEFVRFFVGSHAGCVPKSIVTRIEFEYE